MLHVRRGLGFARCHAEGLHPRVFPDFFAQTSALSPLAALIFGSELSPSSIRGTGGAWPCENVFARSPETEAEAGHEAAYLRGFPPKEGSMKFHIAHSAILTSCAALVLLNSSCSKAPAPQPEEKKEAAAKPAPSVPNIKVTPSVMAKAQTPKPGPKAKKKAVADTFGKGGASITVKGHPGGVNHSFWTEEMDLDGSGNPVEVDEAWDNRHKVLYVSKDRTFTCGNGQTADGSTLMTVYGKGNTLHKPTGSGWWVAELDAGECGVETAGVYGCRFDAEGNNGDCGAATVQSDQDDVVIVPLPGGQAGSSGSAPAQPPAQSSPPPEGGKQ